MKEFVNKIKSLKDNINVDLKGDIAEIIVDPKSWAEQVAETLLAQNADKIIQARKLGEEFGRTIHSNKKKL